MKSIVFALALVLLFSTSTRCRAADKPELMVSIAVPANEKGERWIVYKSGELDRRIGGYFSVVLTNVSDQPIRVWENWNSWGHDNLSFELIAKDGTKSWATSARSTWTINFPSLYEIGPGESAVVAVAFADPYNWRGFPIGPTGTDETVTLRARYTISPSKEGIEKKVWTGTIESAAQKYRFLHDR